MAEAGKIATERLERALAAAAQLALQDEAFLPIFERLQNEFAALSRKNDLLSQARRIAEAHKEKATSDSPELEMQ